VSLADDVGYPALFGLVMAESGGLPVPGETALIAAGALAGQGHLDIALVIALAASAAIIGDNCGYLIGRRGGRWLLERPGRFEGHRRRVLEFGEPFFERHGPKAVFFGRWILGLRVWASWLAGITRMPWKRFLLFNAAGGISWAASVGTLAYFAGDGVEKLVRDFGLGALAVLVCVAAAVYYLKKRRRARAR
jgi:membrane protein DedA with SNARE-associated domain